ASLSWPPFRTQRPWQALSYSWPLIELASMPWSIDQTGSPQETVLIMGAAGYIGSCLVRRLAQSGRITPIGLMRRVRCVSRPDIEIRICDATRQKELAEALRGVDTVVN